MKRLPVFLVVISLVVGSLFSAMHAHAGSVSDDAGMQIVKSMGDNSDANSPKASAQCHQCCHAGSHIALNKQSPYNDNLASQKHFMFNGKTYLLQLNSPPSQPPRA